MYLNTYLKCTGVCRHFSADLTWSANIILLFHLEAYWQTPEILRSSSIRWISLSVRRQRCWYSSFEPSIISGSMSQKSEPGSLWKSSSGHTSKHEEKQEAMKMSERENGQQLNPLGFFPRYFSIIFHIKLLLEFIANICQQSSMKKPR